MPNMSYPGVTGAAVATSPLAISVPTAGERPPVLLDMATAGIALGKIAQYRNAGKQLPEGVAATADGTPTTDPALAKMPLPLGGAKGAGMSLVFELLTSVLVGARTAAEVEDAVTCFRRPVPQALWADLVATGLLPGHVPTPAGPR